MCVKAISWASEQKVGNQGTKLTLIALANYANDEHKCWPSQKTLSEWTESSPRAIRDHLVRLESLGLITRVKRSVNGSFTSDMITLNIHQTQRQILPTADFADGRKQHLPAADSATYPSKEPSLKNIEKRARENTFPENFSSNQTHQRLGQELGIDVAKQIHAFKDFHQSKGTVFKDWDAAFRTWIRNAHKFSSAQNKHQFTGTKAQRQQQDKDWLNELTGKNKRTQVIDITPS